MFTRSSGSPPLISNQVHDRMSAECCGAGAVGKIHQTIIILITDVTEKNILLGNYFRTGAISPNHLFAP